MPTYETLPEGAKLIQNKTLAFLLIPVSNSVDVGLWWQQAGGNPAGKLKATLRKSDGTTVEKLAEDGKVALDNSAPQRIKVLFEPADLDQLGMLKVFAEFKLGDSWLQAETVSVTIDDDPVPD